MIYILNVRPYSDTQFNQHELINECFLILVLYTLYFFTSYVDVQSQGQFAYNIGFIIIGLILICIVWNVLIITRKVLKQLKLKIPALYYTSNIYKRRKQRE